MRKVTTTIPCLAMQVKLNQIWILQRLLIFDGLPLALNDLDAPLFHSKCKFFEVFDVQMDSVVENRSLQVFFAWILRLTTINTLNKISPDILNRVQVRRERKAIHIKNAEQDTRLSQSGSGQERAQANQKNRKKTICITLMQKVATTQFVSIFSTHYELN